MPSKSYIDTDILRRKPIVTKVRPKEPDHWTSSSEEPTETEGRTSGRHCDRLRGRRLEIASEN